ncbi:LLM class flavin-dependent oxidoreductase, partial [Mycobacterium avium subsp. hominissuis]|nr:LLM class flavin-dependent oxidoreductase [Mycobacterium avium subsp. hominissuis]
MRIGVVFPQTEIGSDPAVLRSYAQRVEELGFTHILAYDHVVGADPRVHRGWRGPYDIDSTFHEPFVLFGYLAAIT